MGEFNNSEIDRLNIFIIFEGSKIFPIPHGPKGEQSFRKDQIRKVGNGMRQKG